MTQRWALTGQPPRPGDLVWIDGRVANVTYAHWFQVASVEESNLDELDGWVFITGYPITETGSRPKTFRFVRTTGLTLLRDEHPPEGGGRRDP